MFALDRDIPSLWAVQAARWAYLSHRGLAGVCIAGGALRDLDHCVPFKDVDIFVQVQEPPDYDEMNHILRPEKGWVILDREYMGLDKRDNRITSEVSVVWRYEVEGVEFNAIFLTTEYAPEQFMLRLDFGLSRIAWWADKREVLAHDTYIQDKTNKVFKVRRCENIEQWDRSYKRAECLVKRDWYCKNTGVHPSNFPGYTIDMPNTRDLPLKEQ